MKRRIVGAAIGVALALAAIAPAIASPGSVSLQAGSCYGAGQSWLNYPGGYAASYGCSSSSRYLSASYVLQNGSGGNLAGTWQSYDFAFGNIGNISPVAAVAGTHALQYITAFDGYYSTNTW